MLSDDQILAIVGSELSNSNPTDSDVTIGLTNDGALDYYLGNPNGKEVEGLSSVTSTDVADAIEWIMPQVMKSFTQNNEIVIFDPVHDGDEKQAELESEYVYEVLMKQNDGFIVLHQFVKDALMQKNGILKVYYAEVTKTKYSDYTGISEEQLIALMDAEGVDIVEKSEYIDQFQTSMKQQQIQQQLQNPQLDPTSVQMLQAELEKPVLLYNIKISVERKRGQIYVDPVPPEDFRFNKDHTSINLDTAKFTAHVTTKTASEIMEQYGLTKEQVAKLPTDSSSDSARQEKQGESPYDDPEGSGDDSQREIEVAECYMMIDINETGKAQYCKIDVINGDTPTDILSKDMMDSSPWVATTAFLMSHKFKGLSIADRLKEIQDQKTALWRSMFDNLYLQNNQRHVVIEAQVNMDDLLVSRPGGVIRAKRLDAVAPLATPQLGQESYQMMDYLDRIRAGRTGVDPDGPATPQNIGDRVGSQGVDRLMNAKEELVGLIIRVIAETGIKPLCVKIRDLTIKHVDAVLDFRFRGTWYKIQPSEWAERTKCTVRVGTGTGNHQLQVAALGQVLALQKEIMAQPGQILVNDKKVFDTIDDFCKFSQLNGAIKYFVDPESPEGQQAKQQAAQAQQEAKQKEEQVQLAMVQSQLKVAEAEVGKAEAQSLNVKLRAEIDSNKNQLQLMKQTYEAQLKSMEQRLAEAEAMADNAQKDADRLLKKHEINTKAAVELTRIETQSKTEENENYQSNKEDTAA